MIIIPENLEIHKPDKSLENIVNNTKIKEKVLFKKESDFHNIFVVKNNFGTFLKYKDTYQAGYFDTKYYRGNIPYVNYFLLSYLLNSKIEKILFIGFGSGIIINQFEKLFSNLKTIDIVDIEENVFALSEKFFNFKISDKMNFYLQDAIVYLKTTKKKYDLIVVDVAGDNGIDERFVEDEYFELVKKHLKKKGVFISNLPSSRDIFNPKNKVFLEILDRYKKNFSDISLFNGETSNKIYYKTFFNRDKPVFDITNAILFSSCFEQNFSLDKKIDKLFNISSNDYLSDKIEIQRN